MIYVWKSFLAPEFLGDSPVSWVPGTCFKSTITKNQNGPRTSLVRPEWANWGKNGSKKISWDFPFKVALLFWLVWSFHKWYLKFLSHKHKIYSEVISCNRSAMMHQQNINVNKYFNFYATSNRFPAKQQGWKKGRGTLFTTEKDKDQHRYWCA